MKDEATPCDELLEAWQEMVGTGARAELMWTLVDGHWKTATEICGDPDAPLSRTLVSAAALLLERGLVPAEVNGVGLALRSYVSVTEDDQRDIEDVYVEGDPWVFSTVMVSVATWGGVSTRFFTEPFLDQLGIPLEMGPTDFNASSPLGDIPATLMAILEGWTVVSAA